VLETTAKALDAAMGFLALYEDIQEEVYQEIREVASKDGKLVKKKMFDTIYISQGFKPEFRRLFPFEQGSSMLLGRGSTIPCVTCPDFTTILDVS
jgi:hypothetical protein